MNLRDRTLAGVAVLLCSAGCAHHQRVVQIGPDTFRASRIAQNNRTNFDRLSDGAMGDATAYCKRQGKVVEVVIVEASGPAYGVTKGYTGAEVEFRCVDKRQPI